MNIHSLSVNSLEGTKIDFHAYSGKKILIVNVASECGYTPQYAHLEELYQANKEKLVIIGVPCNDFGGQEPNDAQGIRAFCTLRYGVSFPLTEKMNIRKQSTRSALYEWLTDSTQNGVSDAEVKWNFHKFVIDEQGKWQASFDSATEPFAPSLLEALGVEI